MWDVLCRDDEDPELMLTTYLGEHTERETDWTVFCLSDESGELCRTNVLPEACIGKAASKLVITTEDQFLELPGIRFQETLKEAQQASHLLRSLTHTETSAGTCLFLKATILA